MKVVCIILSIVWLASGTEQSCKIYHTSCQEANPKNNSIVNIEVNGKVIPVYCDVTLTGSPWLVIQRRVSPEENFYRNWTTYREGFGNLKNNFFIGLDNLNAITQAEPQQLYVHLVDFDGQSRYAKYNEFAIGNETESFVLSTLGSYSGNAGDGLRYQQNMNFSTYDRDNDNSPTENCAAKYHGAWWYNFCLHSNLNGAYLSGEYGDTENLFASGISWFQWRGLTYSYKTVQLMIQPN